MQTEMRKQRCQALEKTERWKKKSKLSQKKEQKGEVKRKIEESLPTAPPSDNPFHCSGCTNQCGGWQGWVCLDEKKHQTHCAGTELRLNLIFRGKCVSGMAPKNMQTNIMLSNK